MVPGNESVQEAALPQNPDVILVYKKCEDHTEVNHSKPIPKS